MGRLISTFKGVEFDWSVFNDELMRQLGSLLDQWKRETRIPAEHALVVF